MLIRTKRIVIAALAVLANVPTLFAQVGAVYTKPDVTIDLRTQAGANLVDARWAWADADIVGVEHRAAGPDLKPSGAIVRTHGLSPALGDLTSGRFTPIAPTELEVRRGNGRLSFGWYALDVKLPEKVGALDVAGATASFEIVVDDYAEVYVEGKAQFGLGRSGGTAVAGFNSPNRVVLTRDARPGQTFHIDVLAMNGPVGDPPPNYIWVRGATLDFATPEHASLGVPVETTIRKLDPRLDEIIAPDTKIERIASGFGFTEGPVWVPRTDTEPGHLLFSDPNNNRIYRWDSSDGAVSVFRSHSGYTGADIGRYRQPGSNGLALDPQGRLTINEHGNRRVTRLEKNGTFTVLADRFESKRLNSPNDLVYRSDGAVIFTDPYFGLPGFESDPAKELPYSGVFFLKDGALKLLTKELKGPNGVALSPDERSLYVGDWDEHHKVVMRYELSGDGTLSKPTTFLDLTDEPGDEAIDGVDVDPCTGTLFVSGPGGLHIVSPEGKRLGVIRGPELAANFTLGGDDGRILFLTARTGVYRVQLQPVGGGTTSAR
ncbi:MAG: SMP-30/gluconolactonase/LRE family protein [Tepidisphaeraceae bacterium]